MWPSHQSMSQITSPIRDIAVAQPSFLTYMCTPRVQKSVNNGVFRSRFTYRHGSRLASLGRFAQSPESANFCMVSVKLSPAKFVIKAVATLQPIRSVQHENAKKTYEMLPSLPKPLAPKLNVESPTGDSEVVHDREKLRRERISKANKGNTPWNKGRKHSPETLQRIKERTRLAMQDPKVKMKLINLGHAQSNDTRIKIGLGVKMGWKRRHEKLLLQETGYYNWQNLIAEAARQGLADEEELRWDSFEKLKEQLQKEFIDSEEQRKTMSKPKINKRAPKSLEQRRKIAAAIAAKWEDPNYRNRVHTGMAKYYGSAVGAERKRSSTGGVRSPKKEVSDAEIYAVLAAKTSFRPKPKISKGPLYKDPLAKKKFEMIKNIRAKRTSTDTKKQEALERAKSLITEAEKAAKGLEVAAETSPIAQASLVETRKLIAEAVQLIRSIETEQCTPVESNSIQKPSVEDEQNDQPYQIELNGTRNMETTTLKGDVEDDFDFLGLSFSDTYEMADLGMYNAVDEQSPKEAVDLPDTNGSAIKVNGASSELEASINGSSIKINGTEKANGSIAQAANPTEAPWPPLSAGKKRWVRGRLVEEEEE